MRVLLIVASSVLLVLTGCSIATSTSSAADQESPSGSALPFDSVLLELFGTTDTESYVADLDRTTSELVAQCMRAAGFEFDLPEPADAGLTRAEVGTLEYAETEGFGIVSEFRKAIKDSVRPTPGIDELNRPYLETLPAVDIERFFMALDGEPAEPGQLQTESGCNGQASEQAYADWVRFFEALPQYTAMGEERDTHPDWLAARSEWQTCMLDKGFDYDEPEAIRKDVAVRMDALATSESGGIAIRTADGVQLEPEIELLLSDMFDFERSAAVANFRCTAPLVDAFTQVEREVQQGFVERNQLVIDELLAAS